MFLTTKPMGHPVDLPSKMPLRSSTLSGSLREVVSALCPGRRRLSSRCMKSMLDEYLLMLEEAKKRDHRKIGKEMELFMFSQKVGAGLPLWLPKGADLRFRLELFLRKIQQKYGYLPVVTPHIGNKELYVTSGHWEHYGSDSFRPITTPQEGEEYLLKPMNCPHQCEDYPLHTACAQRECGLSR